MSLSNADIIYEALVERYGAEGPSGETRSLMDLLVQEYWTEGNHGQRKTGAALKQHYVNEGAAGNSLADVERDYWQNVFQRVALSGIDTFNGVAHASFDLDAEAYGDAAAIPSLSDQTANGNDALQGTTASQPVAQTVNGHKVARFDGADDYLNVALPATLSQPNTVIVTFQSTDVSSARALFDSNSGGNRHLFDQTTTGYRIFGGASLSLAVAPDMAWHVGIAIFNGANSKVFLDGGVPKTGNSGAMTLPAARIGADAATGEPWSGDIQFIGLYDGDLYVDDLGLLNAVGQALADRMGITWTDIT